MKHALTGRVVTMDAKNTVIEDGVVYSDGNSIVAIQSADEKAPAGFDKVKWVATGGTIYPGLIELHNHLPYNVLSLGKFTKKYTNRDQWRTGNYSSDVTGPLEILNRDPELVSSIVRYVECKNLLAGVTTSQGLTLATNPGLPRKFVGLTRNVEEMKDKAFPDVGTRVADLESDGAEKFAKQLASHKSAILLHLAEGTDDKTHGMFERLKLEGNKGWAITPALAGIHCVALENADIDLYAEKGGSIVWSPTSNLLLYGETARIGRAHKAGVNIALGSDWSYSGTRNLLAELKVARATAAAKKWKLGSRDLVAMATRNPARALRWKKIGSLEPTHRMDIVVIGKPAGDDPYEDLINATEKDVDLVMVDGVALSGRPALMKALAKKGVVEDVMIDGARKVVLVRDPAMDPDVASVPLSTARARLAEAMKALPELAKIPPPKDVPPDQPALVLDDDLAPIAEKGPPKPKVITAKTLDGLTVAGDKEYWAKLGSAGNMPKDVVDELPE